jgi:hypothetical protein
VVGRPLREGERRATQEPFDGVQGGTGLAHAIGQVGEHYPLGHTDGDFEVTLDRWQRDVTMLMSTDAMNTGKPAATTSHHRFRSRSVWRYRPPATISLFGHGKISLVSIRLHRQRVAG